LEVGFRRADSFIVQNEQDAENARTTIPREGSRESQRLRLRPSAPHQTGIYVWPIRTRQADGLFFELARLYR
jgi:hypothetical protein